MSQIVVDLANSILPPIILILVIGWCFATERIVPRSHVMGYAPAPPSAPRFRPNLDRHGMPRDYATYVWLHYGKLVEDRSPQRMAFLHAHPRPYVSPTRDTR